MNKKKYLFINPYVYLRCNNNSCVIFNTINSEHTEITSIEKVEIFKRLYNYKDNNYYVTELSKHEFEILQELILWLEKSDSGGIIEREASAKQPIIIPPVIRVSNDLANYSEESTEYMLDIKTYVHNLFIYLNSGTESNCNIYKDSYMQFDSPKYSNYKEELDYNTLNSCLNELDEPPQTITLTGTNIFKYKNLFELTSYLFNNFKETMIIFSCDIFDFIDNQNFFKKIFYSNYYVKILIDSSLICENDIIKLKDIAKISLNFIVTTNEELELVYSITGKNNIKNYILLPYLNGNNIDFFEKNVFVEKNDILTKQDILSIASKGVVNKQLFGNVYITEAGNIKLNPNSKSIGNIENDGLYLLINKAFATKQYYPWFLTREEVSPCKKCIYSKLCPSISNYELFLNKFNFCNILQDE